MSTSTEYRASKRSITPASISGQQVIVQSSAPRTRMSMGGGTMLQRTNVMSSRGFMPARPTGEVAALSKKSVQNVKETRNKEKGDLSGLNQKLAEQMESYKYLQGLVKQTQMECEKWKKMRMFDDSKLKELISDEIDGLRNSLSEEKEKNSKLEASNTTLKEKYDTLVVDMDDLRKQMDDLVGENEKLKHINVSLEEEANLLRKDMELKDGELRRLKDRIKDLLDDIERLRDDKETAIDRQLSLAGQVTMLTEELDFVKNCSEQENAELTKIIKHLQNVQPDYSKMWSGQFKEMIQKLQQETDQRINDHMAEVQRNYESKLARIEASAKRDEPDGITKIQTNTLKSQVSEKDRIINDLTNANKSLERQLQEMTDRYNRECEECEMEKEKLRNELHGERCEKEDIERELDELEATKLGLEEEIYQYKCLLDIGTKDLAMMKGNYQSQGGAMLAQDILGGAGGAGGYGSGGGGGMSSSQQSSIPITDPVKKQAPPVDKTPKKKPENARSESSGRMTITKTSKIGITIDELALDGAFVRIFNTASKDIDLSNMKLKRTYLKDRKEEVSTFEFSSGMQIKKGEKLAIYSARFEDDRKGNDLVANFSDCKTWGTGTGEMKLFDKNGKDVATYTMKMSS